MTNLYYGYSKEIHELSENYIRNHIIQNANPLINDLLKMSWEISIIYDAGITEDNIENLYRSDKDIVSYFGLEGTKEEIATAINEIKDNGEDKLEVYEWWQVSEWFYEQLKSINEVVLDSEYGYYWGRTCTGQAIILDGTIQQISKQYI